MKLLKRGLAALTVVASAAAWAASPLPINLQPKYGGVVKNEAERAADDRFVQSMVTGHGGDARKAGADAAARGWQAFQAGNADEAMRRFNQAWLIDPSNAEALWGMGAVTGQRGDVRASVVLFAEAEPALRERLPFRVDHARTLAMDAVISKDAVRIDAALARFAAIDRDAPSNVQNLGNWAMTLMNLNRDDEAWALVVRAQAVRRDALDPALVADLSKRRARAANDRAKGAPELWSGHQALTLSADRCAEQAQHLLVRLQVGNVTRNDLYTYGVAERQRIAVKCVAMGQGSFVYYAVAGDDRAKAEAWRNRIAAGW